MRRIFRQVAFSIVAAGAALMLCATPALAQAQVTIKPEEGVPTNWMTAVRGGIGMNNTEGVAGLMFQSPGMGPGKYVRFRPAIQAAFWSNTFSVAGVLDVAGEMKLPGSKFTLIVGAGTSIGLKHTSCDGCTGTNTGLTGLQIIVGFQNPSGLFFETRAGAGWNHGGAVLVGYFFKGKKK